MAVTPSRYQTSSLHLASFLALRDKPYRLVRAPEGESATWEFDADVLELVNQFEKREATVEPVSYFQCTTKTRRTLFDFLNSGDKAWEEEKVVKHEPSRSRR
jgi:hypothetical protein